jgi:hypothetical protein
MAIIPTRNGLQSYRETNIYVLHASCMIYGTIGHNLLILKNMKYVPPHGNPFLGTPYFANTATNINLVNLGIDVLIRFNVQIIENLVKSAIDIDNKTLGSFYVLTALTLVSQPAREAMPWLYEAGVYGGLRCSMRTERKERKTI